METPGFGEGRALSYRGPGVSTWGGPAAVPVLRASTPLLGDPPSDENAAHPQFHLPLHRAGFASVPPMLDYAAKGETG